MSNVNTLNQFPAGAEPGSDAWTNFWNNEESWGVTPGTRVTVEDLMPEQESSEPRGHVITAAGTLSVAEWFNSFALEGDISHLY